MESLRLLAKLALRSRFLSLTCRMLRWIWTISFDIANPCSPCRDGIHFSSEGSKIVVKEILKVLKDAEWEPSLYWLSMPAEFPEDSPYYVVGPDGETTLNVTDHVCTWQKEWVNI